MGHETRCAAKPGVNHPIKVTQNTDISSVTDVGDQFFVIFVTGLIINSIQTVWALVACFISQSKQACNYAMQTIIFLVSVIYLGFVTYVRYSHAGKVCSGDYLYRPISLQTREQGILGIEGQFLTVFIFASWIQVVIVLIFMAV